MASSPMGPHAFSSGGTRRVESMPIHRYGGERRGKNNLSALPREVPLDYIVEKNIYSPRLSEWK